jgi:DNA repair protein RecN (Recombination protein N)
LAPGGKSRAFINDTPVTLDVLNDWMGRRIDVHSQRETAFLTHPDFLLDLLDGLGTPAERVESVRNAYREWSAAKREQSEALNALQGAQDVDYLSFQFDELVQAGVAEGVYESLHEQHQLLANASGLKSALDALLVSIEGENGASDLLLRAAKAIDASGDTGSESQVWSARLRASVEELRDVAREAERKWSSVEEDPRLLEQLETRLAIWHRLMSKHRCAQPSELVDYRLQLEEQLEAISGAQGNLERLAAQVSRAEEAYRMAAEAVHTVRQEIAAGAANQVLGLLHDLNLPYARFEVRVERSKVDSERGNTLVELWFSANPGTPLLEVRKSASGGERSRVMLALKAVFAQGKGLKTIFFDEIDTGISGSTASHVASIFRKMAQSLQVVVITHLPQVAAAGSTNWRIEKEVSDGSTQTRLRLLSPEEKVEEVARMVSGATVTPAALENARELIFVSLQP